MIVSVDRQIVALVGQQNFPKIECKMLKKRKAIQRDPAFKKVDFKKVRHCFSKKVSSYKKVFSLKKCHFLMIS